MTLDEFLKALSHAFPMGLASSLFEMVVRGAINSARDDKKKIDGDGLSHKILARAGARVAGDAVEKALGAADDASKKQEMERTGFGYLVNGGGEHTFDTLEAVALGLGCTLLDLLHDPSKNPKDRLPTNAKSSLD